ncbi:thrombospondin type 3 repeat-containing protein [Nocardioides sp. B-3]|uniref:thrombospondin type 3 repeat-containing protein n=1 Tax=Nocardioides sp. B-3 TaxID=2895565 RepID=UPI00215252E6|nr:thrombospondin type 3 repeat-containing protein [Nocardioides sp. B-3]UUZ58859.1 thrombospondin type 3 repeat-containing protein [Nocardioides sp. B-3]
MSDKAERTGSANKKYKRRKTDPSKCDTDGGGVNDGREVKLGSDPTRIKSGPNDLESRARNPRREFTSGG